MLSMPELTIRFALLVKIETLSAIERRSVMRYLMRSVTIGEYSVI
jgi:hypothetical protein